MKDGFEHIKRWHDIDVLVCATRSKGQTEAFLQESVGEEAITWIQCPWGYPEHGHFIQLKTESMATLLFDMLNYQLHHLSSNELMAKCHCCYEVLLLIWSVLKKGEFKRLAQAKAFDGVLAQESSILSESVSLDKSSTRWPNQPLREWKYAF